MITFKEQFDKLTEAYIRGEVEPYQPCGCFIGNLLNRREEWIHIRKDFTYKTPCYFPGEKKSFEMAQCIIQEEGKGTYTDQEIVELEYTFMMTYGINGGGFGLVNEDALFKAFEVTLEQLKQIHESKGEIVDEFVFQKRQPV